MNSNYILLQENHDANYEPTPKEIAEEAKYLGIGEEDSEFYWIAREALKVDTQWKQSNPGTPSSLLASLSE
jgi:hypothetical protein